jgi:hypothetical protein
MPLHNKNVDNLSHATKDVTVVIRYTLLSLLPPAGRHSINSSGGGDGLEFVGFVASDKHPTLLYRPLTLLCHLPVAYTV